MCCDFFFQAEDGIRDLVRSRGLGDVYKRQETRMAKALYAVDELTGLIHAAALVRPSKKIEEVEVKSIRKKMKDKAFAANVSRADIENGAKDLGLELDDHIAVVLNAMKGIAGDIGL